MSGLYLPENIVHEISAQHKVLPRERTQTSTSKITSRREVGNQAQRSTNPYLWVENMAPMKSELPSDPHGANISKSHKSRLQKW